MLNGIRVLDLTRVVAGPYCTALLADLGADVIKIERPGRGDDMRWLFGGTGMGSSFAALNRNKRGIAIDLKRPEGVALMLDLARGADVVVENFVPGVAAGLGIGYDDVRAVNPAVVYASISGFGQTGPHARKPGYNAIAQGMSGAMALTGETGTPPTRMGGSVSDTATAYLTFGLICAALASRGTTGKGTHIDASLLSSTIGLFPDHAALFLRTGQRPPRSGNRSLVLAPAEVFPTADGYINITLVNAGQWQRFCQALSDPEMETDPRFVTNEDRLANHPAFAARVEAALATRDTAAWVERFEVASIPAGPVYELDEVFEDAQVRHLETVVEVDQPDAGLVRMLDFPATVSGWQKPAPRPAPRLGEHTAEVLRELGLPDARIAELVAMDVIAQHQATQETGDAPPRNGT